MVPTCIAGLCFVGIAFGVVCILSYAEAGRASAEYAFEWPSVLAASMKCLSITTAFLLDNHTVAHKRQLHNLAVLLCLLPAQLCCLLQAWVQIMANYTKTNDANHLVTIGYEGFWGEYDVDVQYNPGNGWAGITGQNFSRNMAHTEIDFAEIHYWPDEWFANQEDITYDASQFLTSWFTQHAIVANNLGKPLLLEEFGKAVNVSLLLK